MAFKPYCKFCKTWHNLEDDCIIFENDINEDDLEEFEENRRRKIAERNEY